MIVWRKQCCVFPAIRCRLAYLVNDIFDLFFPVIRVNQRIHIQFIKELTSLNRIQDIPGFIHTKLQQDGFKFFLQDIPNTEFDSIFKYEIQCLDRMGLTNPVDPADPLLDPHGIPW